MAANKGVELGPREEEVEAGKLIIHLSMFKLSPSSYNSVNGRMTFVRS